MIKAAACTLSADVPPGKVLEVRRESEVPIVVKVRRKERAKAGVNFSAARPAAGITIKPAVVPPGKDEVTLALSGAKQARTGLQQNIIITGVMRTGRETITRYAPAIAIQVIAAP